VERAVFQNGTSVVIRSLNGLEAKAARCVNLHHFFLVLELLVEVGHQTLKVTSVSEYAVQSSAPAVKFLLVRNSDAVVISRSDHLYLLVVKEFHFLGTEVCLQVAMTQSAHLLCVHPVEESFFPSIAPCPHGTILTKNYGVVLPESDVLDFDTGFLERINQFRLSEVDVRFVTVAQNTPVTIAKSVEVAVARNYGRVA
jgi:hypothetical protein